MSGQENSDQQAWDSFASILSYYVKNRASLEKVPDWVKKAESGEIQIGVAAGTVPSDEQSEELKKKLKEALQHAREYYQALRYRKGHYGAGSQLKSRQAQEKEVGW